MLALAGAGQGAAAKGPAPAGPTAHGAVITQRASYDPFEELPADADTAVAILQNRLLSVAPGSPEERDIQYLLRLGTSTWARTSRPAGGRPSRTRSG